MRKLTMLFVLISFILFSNISCKDNVKSIQEEQFVFKKQKDLLVGTWIESKDHMPQTTIYEFYKNGIWKQTITYDGEIRITKGKYTLGAEKEVYLRSFGSQHWRNNKDTICDYKTSIGIGLFFLNDSLLVNNQEDYQVVYRKTKK